MIWEVRKGRECSATLTASLEAITALQNLTHSQGQLIELRGKEVATLKELDGNWSLRLQNQTDLYFIEKSELKQKVKNQRRKILGLSGLSLVLFLALVL